MPSRLDYLKETSSSFDSKEQLGSLEFAAATPGGGGGNRFALPEHSKWKLPTVEELLAGVALTKEPIRNSTDHFVCLLLENKDKPGTFKKFPVGYFTDNLPVCNAAGEEAEMNGFDGKPTKRMRPVGGVAQAWQQKPGEMVAYAAYRALAWAQANNVDHFEVEKKLDVTTPNNFSDTEKSRQRVCHWFDCKTSDGSRVKFTPENMPAVDPAPAIKAAIDKLKGATGAAPAAGDDAPF